MADDPELSVDQLQTAIDEMRQVFEDIKTELGSSLRPFFAAPADIADELLSHSEEFGREHAFDLFVERLHRDGETPDLGDMTFGEAAERIAGQVDQLLDAQDRLDALTTKREALLGRSGAGTRIVNIHGEEFTVDAAARELRAEGRDERHALPEEAELSVTQQMARETDAGLAEVRPTERDRSRSR